MEENSKKNLLVALSNRISELEKQGIMFLLKFKDLGEKIELEVTGKKKITFILSFDGHAFFLENQERRTKNGRLTFFQDDMISYMLVLANEGSVIGKLEMPGLKIFPHLENIPQT